ncbi:MAG: hypothetical protein NTU41_14650, partial [Chloroflexi bacterium]|nr:hypothetical protein [Chloroflexota bacterium]
GKTSPSPASGPRARSALDVRDARRSSQSSFGGKGWGTKTQYPPGERTSLPEVLSWNRAGSMFTY